MNKFKTQLKLIEEALLKPMSDERVQELDDEKIKIQIDEIKKRATLNSNSSYDVDGDVNLSEMDLTELPMKFGKVHGNFWCHYNKLTSLEGGPREVTVNFYCFQNKLTNLEGGPSEVGGNFDCSDNTLTSLEGCPREVGGGFWCSNNKLTNLEGGPREVSGGFYCYNNKVRFTKNDVIVVCNVKGNIHV